MAILDGIKNAVTANVARSANKVAVNGLRNIVGDVFGVNLNPTNPAAKLTNRPTKFTTESLAYPAGVEGDDMQGHHILFEIVAMTPAKLADAGTGVNTQLVKTVDAELESQEAKDKSLQLFNDKVTAAAQAGASRGFGSQKSIRLSQGARTRIDTLIALYMPPSISVSYASNYGEQEIGAMAGAAAGAIKAFSGQSADAQSTALNAALDTVGKGLQKGALATLDTVAPGANALIALEKGAIITPRMELMFEGIGRRSFSYDFVFIPKDINEAETIKEIVKKFKLHMASEYTDTSFREMTIPSMFNISYKYKNADNNNLNKISTCVLENMDVNYGADRFIAYENGVPQTTKISLKFREMEIITKDQIELGF
jgi:hypothetical protein